VIANSELTAEATGLPPDRVVVVPNPIDPVRCVPAADARRALGLPVDGYVVANLAHFHEAKGQLSLVRAFATLDQAHLVLAGGDLYGDASRRYRRNVEEEIARLGLTARVHLPGAVDDVDFVYAAADVVVHAATRPEAFGRTIVEAMLARRPVVASTPGMPGRLVRDGHTGLLYDPDDLKTLARHLEALEHDPQLRDRLSSSAAAWAGDQFSAERAATAVIGGYASVVHSTNRSGTYARRAMRAAIQDTDGPSPRSRMTRR
jgi:glycosyltransferase involved in cell wall biosynthesis